MLNTLWFKFIFFISFSSALLAMDNKQEQYRIYFQDLMNEINEENNHFDGDSSGETNIKKYRDKYYLRILLNTYGIQKYINDHFESSGKLSKDSEKKDWEKFSSAPFEIGKKAGLRVASYIYEHLEEHSIINWLSNYKGDIKQFLEGCIPYYFFRLVERENFSSNKKIDNKIKNNKKALFFINLMCNAPQPLEKLDKKYFYNSLNFIGYCVSQGIKDDDNKIIKKPSLQDINDQLYEYKENWAFSTEYPRIDDLDGSAESDMEFGEGVLRSMGFHGKTLKNDQVTHQSIKESINELKSKINRESKSEKKSFIILFYSAHAAEEPYNEKLNIKVHQKMSNEPSVINFKDFVQCLEGLKNANVLIIIDTCYAGKAQSSIEELKNLKVENVNIMVAVASAKDKETPELISAVTKKHVGKFTYKFYHTLLMLLEKEDRISIYEIVNKIIESPRFAAHGATCFLLFGEVSFVLERQTFPDQAFKMLTFTI